MADRALARLFWRLVDDLDHVLLLVRLRIVDAVCAPEPKMVADEMREADRERLRDAFPNALPEGRDRD